MKYFRLAVTALTSALVLGSAFATSAYALPEFLPFNSGTKAFTSVLDSGEAVLESKAGNKVKCKKAEGSGGLETETLGTFKINFGECGLTILGVSETCTGTSDAKGIVLSEGSFHYVFDTLGTGETLGVAILFLSKETSFECGSFAKNSVKGDVLCLILTPLTSSTVHLFHCSKGSAAGTQAQTKYWNDSGTAVTAQLLSELNGGTFEEANEQVLATICTPEAGAFMGE